MERFSRIDGGSSRSIGRHSKLEGRRSKEGLETLLRTVRPYVMIGWYVLHA